MRRLRRGVWGVVRGRVTMYVFNGDRDANGHGDMDSEGNLNGDASLDVDEHTDADRYADDHADPCSVCRRLQRRRPGVSR